MMTLLSEIHRRDRALAVAGCIFLALCVLAIPAACLDTRTVTPLDPWAKPMKFMLSFTLFSWTMAWLIGYLPLSFHRRRTLGRTIATILTVEMAILIFQAARGTQSHFNTSTPVDAALASTMGALIMGLSGIMFLVFLLFCHEDVQLPQAHLWGIRAGLALFLLGTIPGWAMIYLQAHTVGASDGGPGLTWFDWSLRAGDLRIAHFLGLHALQVLPIFGAVISRRQNAGRYSSRVALAAACSAYCGLMVIVYLQALSGQPLLG